MLKQLPYLCNYLLLILLLQGEAGQVAPYQLSVPSAAVHGGSTGDISAVGESVAVHRDDYGT